MPEINKYVARANSNAEPGFGGVAGSPAKRYRIKSLVESNYLVCRSWNGSVEGGVDVKVALPTLLRLVNQPSVDHELWPQFNFADAGEDIFAVKPTGGTGLEDVDWLMLHDGRFWALDIELCNARHALFHCSALLDT
jgi:hypothetical protein